MICGAGPILFLVDERVMRWKWLAAFGGNLVILMGLNAKGGLSKNETGTNDSKVRLILTSLIKDYRISVI